MKNVITFLTIAATVALFAACDKYTDGYFDYRYYETTDSFMTIRNFSSDTTVWFIPEKQYSETLPTELSEWQKISVYELLPHSETTLTFDSEDNYLTPVETYGTGDKLAVYVFPKRVWRTHTWSELVSGKLWTGFRSYSVDEMIAAKKIVTYPFQ